MVFLISYEKRDLAQIVGDSLSVLPTDKIRRAKFVIALLISGVWESGDFACSSIDRKSNEFAWRSLGRIGCGGQ